MKSLKASSSGMKTIQEAIDRWKSVEACNCNREDEIDYDREDEESWLVDRLRNLSITPNDDGHMGLTTREAEDLQWWSGRALDMTSIQKHCAYGMHKVHKDYKNAEKRRDEGCVERNHTRGNGCCGQELKYTEEA